MARTKEFDPDTALRAAMELFIAQGYEATSMADLVGHLGISRASLYATFECKEELYRRALDLYLDQNPLDMAVALSQPGPVLPRIHAVVEQFATQTANGDRCLVVGAAIERMGVDGKVARKIESAWDRMETSLVMALTRARAQGELSQDVDPQAKARFILVMLQGIRVFANSNTSSARLSAAVDQMMAGLG